MENSKKIIYITLIPALLTLYFIVRILVPSFGSYGDLRAKYLETKENCKETQESIEKLKDNKKYLAEIEKLNERVYDFDTSIPSEFQDEFFLVDIGKFSESASTKVTSVSAKAEKEYKIIPAVSQDDKKNKKKKKKTKKKKDVPENPILIYEKPFEIKVLGNYKQVIKFVKNLENYQRKFLITGISAEIAKDDDKKANPRIELTIEGSTFKAEKTNAISE